ncbi:MAG: hypothetical protein SWJ54_06650 [Cyanobacteriota bacterium]|nr:hypothetical protein [Cyanobacteriota bacterium]
MFLTNLGFVALFAGFYAGFVDWGDQKGQYSFGRWEVACLIGLHIIYVAVIFLFVL